MVKFADVTIYSKYFTSVCMACSAYFFRIRKWFIFRTLVVYGCLYMYDQGNKDEGKRMSYYGYLQK